jgi:hypothetical protein
MTLSRYHVTRQYSHVGNWHRDGRPNENNVLQASIFLFNEQGLEIIPGSHTRENSKRERQCLNISDHSNLPNSLHLKAKKGSILIFHPAILHRGISINSRANIHFRFEVDHHYSYGEGFKNCHLFNKDWGSILDNKNTVLINSNIIKYARDESIAGYLKRVIKSIIHFLIFWLPLSSFVYRRFGSYPSLIVRKYFKVK